MITRLVLLLACAMCGSALIAQGWSAVRVIELPVQPATDISIDLRDGRLAAGCPDGSGQVFLFGRHAGGMNQWDLTELLHGSDISAHIGSDARLVEGGIVVGGGGGVWQAPLSNDGSVLALYQLDHLPCRSLLDAPFGLVVANSLFQGGASAFIKLYRMGIDGSYSLHAGFGVQAPPLVAVSCPGTNLGLAGDSILVMADVCYSNDAQALQNSGKIEFRKWNEPAFVNDCDLMYGGIWPVGSGLSCGRGFGRSILMIGDTLFVGWGINESSHASFSAISMFRKLEDCWEWIGSVNPPLGSDGMPQGDIGHALATDGEVLMVGTSVGLAFYSRQGGAWEFQHQDTLGAAVTAIVVDEDVMAAAVPNMVAVHLYQQLPVAVQNPGRDEGLLRAIPNPAYGAFRIVSGSLCDGCAIVSQDALGRDRMRIPWNGREPLELDAASAPGITLLRWEDSLGRVLGVCRTITTSAP